MAALLPGWMPGSAELVHVMCNDPEACPPLWRWRTWVWESQRVGMNCPLFVPKVIVMNRSEDELVVPGLLPGELDETLNCIKVNVKGGAWRCRDGLPRRWSGGCYSLLIISKGSIILRRRRHRGRQGHRRLDGWRKHGLDKGQGGMKEMVPKSFPLRFIQSHWVSHQSGSACRSGCGCCRRLVLILILAILRLVPDTHALVLVVMGAPVVSHFSLYTLDLDGLLLVWILELPFYIVGLFAVPGLAIAGGLVWSARGGWSVLLGSLVLLRLEGLELSLESQDLILLCCSLSPNALVD